MIYFLGTFANNFVPESWLYADDLSSYAIKEKLFNKTQSSFHRQLQQDLFWALLLSAAPK